MTTAQTFLLAWGFSGWELAIILVIGLLIFGRRLPELGRSVGKTIVEFKKGLAGIESEVNNSANSSSASPPSALPAGDRSGNVAAKDPLQTPKN
ncbi:MAG: twin-arginine translocase TatA/TatE family subunit [Planctomycetes bacterium]|nr:twin-arginine translocase TatA/TatE family subunit [Planctomycetota bacterium]